MTDDRTHQRIKRQILGRRAHFIAAAVAGVSMQAAGCSEARTCLDIAVPEDTADADAPTEAAVCLSIDAVPPDGPADVLDATDATDGADARDAGDSD
jgi:hypothetical protein